MKNVILDGRADGSKSGCKDCLQEYFESPLECVGDQYKTGKGFLIQ